MPNQPEVLFNETLNNRIDVERYSESVKTEVNSLLTNTYKAILGNVISEYSDSLSVSEQRQRNLLGRLDKLVDTNTKQVLGYTEAEFKKFVPVQAEIQNSNLNSSISFDLFNVQLTANRVEAIATKSVLDGKVIGDWWEKKGATFKDEYRQIFTQIAQEVKIGSLQGKGVNEIVRQFTGEQLTSGLFPKGLNQAKALVHSSVMTVANEANNETIQQNKRFIKNIEWLSTLDLSTTVYCQVRDGKFYTLDGQPIGHKYLFHTGPPGHWGCRSTTIAVMKTFREMLADKNKRVRKAAERMDKKISSKTRASMGGNIPKEPYSTWLKSRSLDDKIEAIGATRARMLDKGMIGHADLVHQDGRPLTIKEIMRKNKISQKDIDKLMYPDKKKVKKPKPRKIDPELDDLQKAEKETDDCESELAKAIIKKEELERSLANSEEKRKKDELARKRELKKEETKRNTEIEEEKFLRGKAERHLAREQRRREADEERYKKELEEVKKKEKKVKSDKYSVYNNEILDTPDKIHDAFTNFAKTKDKDPTNITYNKRINGIKKESNSLFNNEEMDISEILKKQAELRTIRIGLENEQIAYNKKLKMDILRSPIKTKIDLNFGKNIPSFNKNSIKSEIDEVLEFTGYDKLKSVNIKLADEAGRANYDIMHNTLNLYKNDFKGTATHEFGHHLEDILPNGLDDAVKFFNKRTRGTSPVRLGDGYRDDEVYYPGNWINKYMGKKYVHGGKVTATELISTGVQYLIDDAEKFAKDDPDMFKWILSILKGMKYD